MNHILCVCVCNRACTCTLSVSETRGSSSPSSSWLVVSGSAMNVGFSCRIHFLYTLITLRVAEASQDGSRKAYAVTQKQMMHTHTIDTACGAFKLLGTKDSMTCCKILNNIYTFPKRNNIFFFINIIIITIIVDTFTFC